MAYSESSRRAWRHNQLRGKVSMAINACDEIMHMETASMEAQAQAGKAYAVLSELAKLMEKRHDQQ